ncbi:LuxR C-terminal-related transcriptional regulator [Caulobacter hibisci]|uniref:LuxR C-terminal-related transcriptional regulator n=1 Tax=Caulobacter hibisci TaxID=2035993 RepID=UPI0018E2BFC6|nr:LuxR C-terminal-related transcriptional regulator [Caulobacter hibisci]
MPDLTSLSAVERRVLLLLARGHTAKTAAAELGTTEGAINERLREARRKTGVGSSRQLARLVAGEASGDGLSGEASPREAQPQETGDRKIGLAGGGGRGQARRRSRAGWPLFAGAFAMITLAAMIGAYAALALAERPAPSAAPAGTPSPPRVTAVSPAPGTVAPAGRLALTVTFDQPMQAGWSFIARDPATYPDCERTPKQSADRRSFTLACTVQAGRAYEIGFNSDRHRNFASEAGVPAIPALVRFKAR